MKYLVNCGNIMLCMWYNCCTSVFGMMFAIWYTRVSTSFLQEDFALSDEFVKTLSCNAPKGTLCVP